MKIAYLIEPPFSYLDQSGAATGCDIALARYVFDQLGIGNVEFVKTEFAELLPGLERGDWQMTTGLFASPERQQLALFSRPIWALPDGLLVRVEEATRITGYRSLAIAGNVRLAVIRRQLQHETALELGIPPDRISLFETYRDAATAVQDGQVTAFASVCRAHEGFLQNSKVRGLSKVEVPPCEKPAGFGCFGFARTATRLKDHVDHVLNPFVGGSEHRHLMRAYGFSDDDVDRLL